MAGAGYKLFTAGAVLTAAQMNTFVNEQTVMVFASTAARDAALTTVKAEGNLTYQSDTNNLTSYSGTLWSTIGPVSGAQTSWVPVVTQSGTVTNTPVSATYMRIGRKVFFETVTAITGAGTGANLVTVSLPVTALSSNGNTILGMGYITDTSAAATYWGPAVIASTTTLKIVSSLSNTGATLSYLGTTNFTAALANTDAITVSGSYEAAADA